MPEAATLPELLRPRGYVNYMLGKWHVTPLYETGPTGPFDGWPLGRGFDRFYGFMAAGTDPYAPELVRDNTPLKRYRQNTHGGGICDPLVISWPVGLAARGELRLGFRHATDLLPTLLDLLGISPPARCSNSPSSSPSGWSRCNRCGGRRPSAASCCRWTTASGTALPKTAGVCKVTTTTS